MTNHRSVTVIGAGLAGTEAAWQAAQYEIPVTLYEMRPHTSTSAHRTPLLAELTATNSFRSDNLDRAPGVIKHELRKLDSIVIEAAESTSLDTDNIVAVDRKKFAENVTRTIEDRSNIDLRREEIKQIPANGPVVIAAGGLICRPLARALFRLTNQPFLFYYEVTSPIVHTDTIATEKTFRGQRYPGEDAEHLFCPMDETEYNTFCESLIQADIDVELPDEFSDLIQGRLPIEIMVHRGREDLRHSRLRPPNTLPDEIEQKPFATVQLSFDSHSGDRCNMTRCQTALERMAQDQLFGMIGGLENAEFARYGRAHRKAYINSPKLLERTFQLRRRPDIFVAGALTGLTGYNEVVASGLLCGINAGRVAMGEEPVLPPENTMLAAMGRRLCSAEPDDFQPLKANFGWLPQLETQDGDMSKKEKRHNRANNALDALDEFRRALTAPMTE